MPIIPEVGGEQPLSLGACRLVATGEEKIMNSSTGSLAGRFAVGVNGHAAQSAGQAIFFEPGSGTTAPACDGGNAVSVQEFALRHLKTPAEIEEILHLRKAIDLSVHSHAPTNFVALEKKETSAVLSGPSNCAGKS